MINTSLVIQRNETLIAEHDSLAIVSPPANDDLSYLNPRCVYTFDYRVYQSHAAKLGDKIQYSLDSDEHKFDAAVVYMPKSKDELKLTLNFIGSRLSDEATLYLVGEKKEGIASASKLLQIIGSDAHKIDSAKHCQFWRVYKSETFNPFNIADWIEHYDVTLAEQTLKVASIPGVFSFKRLDEGSQLLLENLPKKLQGRILDFGCGAGLIGAFAKKCFSEIDIELIDINLFALICSRLTLENNGLEGLIYPSDGWSDVKGRVNGVLTNPPFHSGVKTEYSTTEDFIRQAPDKMSKFAPLFLVANNFLKYGPLIEKSFDSYKLQAENSKFKLYYARR